MRVQLLGRVRTTSRYASGTITVLRRTSRTASSGARLRTGYHAPRRSSQRRTSSRRRAHRSADDWSRDPFATAVLPPASRVHTAHAAQAMCWFLEWPVKSRGRRAGDIHWDALATQRAPARGHTAQHRQVAHVDHAPLRRRHAGPPKASQLPVGGLATQAGEGGDEVLTDVEPGARRRAGRGGKPIE